MGFFEPVNYWKYQTFLNLYKTWLTKAVWVHLAALDLKIADLVFQKFLDDLSGTKHLKEVHSFSVLCLQDGSENLGYSLDLWGFHFLLQAFLLALATRLATLLQLWLRLSDRICSWGSLKDLIHDFNEKLAYWLVVQVNHHSIKHFVVVLLKVFHEF